ncbi:hypothetical protein K6T79_05400 [Mycolicibacter sp. MYC098]|uniref:DUF559 domain-containing protein n=1 Tax=[Mycobacterium] crassicus TaxID=2872309 RepID=A0ABU5XGL2_9MYCO|nr:hypothetical protein [Mycolicibacter sp. MYC098]MEB3020477.1 hypothetical protein [Mycolicibacter sp. MYC098]
MSADPAPFIGSEALARGLLNRHQLRSRFRAELPDVYVPKEASLSLRQRTVAAWLWSRRNATVAGAAAAAWHGTRWIDDQVPVELIHANPRAPRGVITRRDELRDGEVQTVPSPSGDIALTTPERTAFDIGRRGQVRTAVARLDALFRATNLRTGDVTRLALSHPGKRGLAQLASVLDLVDAGAQSPRETYLRLLLIAAGLPRPQTQIRVVTDEYTYHLDLGWEGHMVAVEYDGDQHRTDRWQFVSDIRRLERLERLGWVVIRVVAEDRPADIVRRVRQALESRRPSVR